MLQMNKMLRMSKVLKIFFITSLIFNLFTTQALAIKITVNESQTSFNRIDWITENNIKNDEVFYFFSRFFKEETPDSYKYISLNFKWVEKNSDFEDSLKILVYNDKIENLDTNISSTESIKAYSF